VPNPPVDSPGARSDKLRMPVNRISSWTLPSWKNCARISTNRVAEGRNSHSSRSRTRSSRYSLSAQSRPIPRELTPYKSSK
jgi:hypothetical protein